MKTFKKLSAIAIFSFAALLSSCDSGYDDTYKVRNGLDRDVKLTQGCFYGTNENVTLSDTIVIKPDETKVVYQEGGIGYSPFDGIVQDIDYILYNQNDYPYIIFDDSIDYKIYDYSNEGIIKTFEKSFFKKSCWEVLSRNDNNNIHEVLYTITEEDYQNAIVLYEYKPDPIGINGFSVSECLRDDRGVMYDNDTIYAVAINDNSLKIRTSNTYFNCCSEEFWEEISVEGNKISIYMFEDDKEPCDCECPTSVEFVLDNLQLGQTYNIVLLRNVYGGYFSFEVVFERDTNLMFIRQ